VGDSEFNRMELEELGFTRTDVLPVVPGFSHLDGAPDSRVYAAYDDDRTNVLFVGRLIPNKRPDQLIRYFHAYQTLFEPDARLILAGSFTQFERYLAQLHDLVARLGTRNVHIVGQVSDAELTALYDVADLFLCASEHEGFCVPLIEAFYKRVPVLAYASTAVPATMDGGGILYDSTDPAEVAGLMDAVLEDESLEARVLTAQDAALVRLLTHDFAATLLKHVNRVLSAPPRPPVAVAADFWQQFKLSEELEDIRDARPSAFHALPWPSERALVADVGHRA
jgi:glycosyltransferase involved in cell wall biosynthesis